jgi:hypothetical protein
MLETSEMLDFLIRPHRQTAPPRKSSFLHRSQPWKVLVNSPLRSRSKLDILLPLSTNRKTKSLKSELKIERLYQHDCEKQFDSGFWRSSMNARAATRQKASKTLSAQDFFDAPIIYPPRPKRQELLTLEGSRSLPSPPPRTAVNLNVPFVHQLWDTPDTFDGHWACGPTSCTMVLGFYKLLEPHPISVSSPSKHPSKLGWYLSNSFTHQGHTFNALAEAPVGRTKRTKSTPGIYGTVMDNHPSAGGWCTAPDDLNHSGKGIRALMRHFLPAVGLELEVKAGLKDQTRATVTALFRRNLDAGHPIIVSGFLFGFHHIVVLRGYFVDAVTKKTKWIVNDPYGYRTKGGFDGANVVYSFEEIGPKWAVLFKAGAPD